MVELNKQQLNIINQDVKPILALAGAGSGKTTVITYRILHLIENGADPSKICSVTFTNKAAKELKSRISNVVGKKSDQLTTGTFHGVCCRYLRKYGKLINLDTSFTIADADDSLKILKELNSEYDKDTLSFISSSKSLLQSPAELAMNRDHIYNKARAKTYEDYETKLHSMNMLDFDDLINYTVRLFRSTDLAKEKIDHLLVDEFQDISYNQKELCKLMAVNNSILAVGDDNQNIYSWRNADVEYILGFKRDFPSGVVMNMERNYRSSGNIVIGSNGVISKNIKQYKKRLFTEKSMGEKINIVELNNDRDEATYVTERIKEYYSNGDDYKSIAVLYRTNLQSRSFEESFVKAAIPYRIIGTVRFYERAEIRDIVAYIQLLCNNKNDIAFKRIVNVPKRGVGKASIDKIAAYANEHNYSLFDASRFAKEIGLPKKQIESLNSFINTMDTVSRQIGKLTPKEIVTNLTVLISYNEYLNDDSKKWNVDSLIGSMNAYDNMQDLLENIALMSDTDEIDSSEAVTVMTVHSAKGLEFDTVFIVGAEEGLFPHKNTKGQDGYEEERRLFYVAMTRAAKHLHIITVKKRYMIGKELKQIISRFIQDIPKECVKITKRT